MEIKRFTEGAIGKGLYSDPTGELCGYHHVERLIAERDALQLRLNAVEEENDRLRKDCVAMRAAIDETGCSFEEIGDMYADAALNDRRYRLLRDRMTIEDFPSEHPEWSTPSESESVRIDQMCDRALTLENRS